MYDNLNLTNSELEARTSKSFSIFSVIICSAIVIYFAFSQGKNLLNWTVFNPNGILAIVFLGLLLLCIFYWLQFFDREPQLKIDKEGIWIRKNILPFSKARLLPWDTINFFYVLQQTQKRITSQHLIIGQKNIETDVKIDLYGLDKSTGSILILLRKYSKQYNFHDLGKEVKT